MMLEWLDVESKIAKYVSIGLFLPLKGLAILYFYLQVRTTTFTIRPSAEIAGVPECS